MSFGSIMKYGYVYLSDLEEHLTPRKYLSKLDKRRIAIERRLTRLYRCHYPPHKICEWLDLTPKKFVEYIQELIEKGVCLSFDSRTNEDFKDTKPPSKMTTGEFNDLVEDNKFYTSCGLTMAERVLLLKQTRSRIRDIEHKEPKLTVIDNSERDKQIAEVFLNTETKKGLKAELAKTWNLSRKSIDLILEKQGIEPITSTKRQSKPRSSKAPLIVSYYKELSILGLEEAHIRKRVAQKAKCSISYVIKVINAEIPVF